EDGIRDRNVTGVQTCALPISSRPNNNVFWKQAFMESLLYTGIMHSFNVTTEAGTRDTLNGHWFQNYVGSVSELRGWSDSDRFMRSEERRVGKEGRSGW